MSFHGELQAAAAYANPEEFGNFKKRIDPEWIDEALLATGTATVRKRRLPAVQVIWLVIGMALFRNRCIEEVAAKLNLCLPGPRGPVVASSAIPQARARVGEEPVRWLFERTGSVWAEHSADSDRWRGLALYSIDGSSLRVPDSQKNRDFFGGHSGGERGDSGYPLARVVGLMALRSHILKAARFGPFDGTSEDSLTKELLPDIPDNSLTVLDRNFVKATCLIPIAVNGRNRHWLTRAKKNTKMKVIERLGRDDNIVELNVSTKARSKDPSLPKHYSARAIRYQRKGFRAQTLLTSLLDAKEYPKKEIVLLYHERWEIELGYGEVKTEMLERQEAIRSKTPMGVRQEIWGIMIAFNLVRLEMERMADQAGVPPIRISFITSLHMIRDELLWCAVASPGAIPKHLLNLRADLRRFILPPRRSGRSYPRAVKLKVSKWPRKKPTTTMSKA